MENLGRIIALFSGKGGVGKTTVVSNVGVLLAQNFNKRITVVDCNITTSHLGLYLGLYYFPITLNKVLRGESELQEAIYNHFSGMKIVPASLSLIELEGVDISKMDESIRLLSEDNDIVLLDSSPGFGREALACLKSCEEVLYVTTPHIPSVLDIVKSQEVAKELNVKPLGIVLNMVEGKGYEMTKSEIEQLTGLPVIASIPYDKNVKRALAEKLPVVILKPNSPASREFLKISRFLLGMPFESESLFSRILDALRLKSF